MSNLHKIVRKQSNRDRFINGVLTADGCTMRHTSDRDNELNLVDPESSQYGKNAWREEMNMLASAHSLIRMGARIRRRRHVSERLETFIRRNSEKLKD